jgi:Zn-dependent metalloprotease
VILAAGVAMIKRVPALLGLGCVTVLLPALAFAAPVAREVALRAFIKAPENDVVITQRANGTVNFIGARPQHPIPETSLLRWPEDRAHAFLKSNRSLFIDDATPLTLVTTRVHDSDHVGISHVRVQQMFQGLPVRGADAVVRLNAAGVTAVSSKLISTPLQLSVTPVIGSDVASGTAQSIVLKKYGPVPATLSVPQLEIFDVGLFHGQPGQPQLTWFIEANGDALYERIWISASSGALAYNYSQLMEAAPNRLVFDANGGSTLSATPARSETQGSIGIADVDDAYNFVGDFWDYFFTAHGRDSFDGNGIALTAVVRYCTKSTGCPFKGAYWDGGVQRIFLGEGYATDDVIGHELTHAVIDSTSKLTYAGESGALNESYADIFGETIDLLNGKGDDRPIVRWMIGEDLPGYAGIGIRNLRDPTLRAQPGKVTDTSYRCDAADAYGVHTNSGVANHAYALMVDGGDYNGYSVKGIGLDKAARIQYRTLLFLQEHSNLADNFNGLNQACNELTIGNDGITHDDCAQVKAAALAVQMTTPPCQNATPPAPPAATPAPVPVVVGLCPVGQVVRYVFSDDFENPASGNWVTSTSVGVNLWLSGGDNPSIYISANPASGSFSLHAAGGASLADASVMMKNDVILPANAAMQFAGSYDFETGFDGAVVEYSVDTGSSWQDAGALIKLGRNYDGVLLSGSSNPLRGRAAFTGHTGGPYVNSQLDLSGLAQRTVRFRFRMGTDNLVASPGWWIDNLSIYGCATTTGGMTVTPTQGLKTTEAGGSASFTVVLRSAPTANVNLTLIASNPREGAVVPSVVTFNSANWNVPKTVTVTGVDDVLDDGDVAYAITTSVVSLDPSYNNLIAPNVDVTNVDNDDSALVVTPLGGLVTTEAGGTATFTVALTSQPTADVTVSFVSTNRREGRATPSVQTFTPATWNLARTITLKGVDDAETDGTVAYFIAVNVSSSLDQKYAALPELRISATNIDNDPARFIVTPTTGLATSEAGGQATFLVRLSSKPSADVSLNLASSNPAEGTLAPLTLTFTSVNWAVPQAVVVTGVDDVQADGNIQYTAIFKPGVSSDPNYSGLVTPDVVLVNIDNDVANILVTGGTNIFTSEAGGTVTFTLVLTKAPTGNVSIGIASSNMGEGIANRTTIVFTASNWSKPTLVTVTGIDDNALDGDVLYSIVTAPAISGDVAYNGMNAADVLLFNRDDDGAALVIKSAGNLTTSESGGVATFGVALAKPPNADVSLLLVSSNTDEGSVQSSPLLFTVADWNIEQTVTVTGVDDRLIDGNIAYGVTLDATDSDDVKYRALPVVLVAVLNLDNEARPVQLNFEESNLTIEPPGTLITTESGGAATFTIVLTQRPLGEVKIALSSSNPFEGIVNPESLTFTTDNWNVPQTVHVVGVDDKKPDHDVSYEIIIGPADATGAAVASGQKKRTLAAINKDNDKIASGAFDSLFLFGLLAALFQCRRRFPQ